MWALVEGRSNWTIEAQKLLPTQFKDTLCFLLPISLSEEDAPLLHFDWIKNKRHRPLSQTAFFW